MSIIIIVYNNVDEKKVKLDLRRNKKNNRTENSEADVSRDEGFGLVESMIAIIVAGLASVALISVAVDVIQHSNRNEIRDAITQYAVEGLERMRVIADDSYNDNIASLFASCNTGDYVYGYIDQSGGDLIGTFKTAAHDDLCSQLGTFDEADCETLPMPSRKSDRPFFYREIALTPVIDGSCNKLRVHVSVGIPGDTKYEETDIVLYGYIAP